MFLCETIRMIHKVAAMGNWWWTALSQQCAEFFGKTSNHSCDSAPPLQPRFGTLRLLAFPKTKVILEREEISDCQWDSARQLMVIGELCEVPGCLLWRGLRCHCPMYSVSCIFFNKCLYFSYYMAGYLLDRPLMFFG